MENFFKNIGKRTAKQFAQDLFGILTEARRNHRVACVYDDYDVVHRVCINGLAKSTMQFDGVEVYCSLEEKLDIFHASHGNQLYRAVARWHQENSIGEYSTLWEDGFTRQYDFSLYFEGKLIKAHDMVPLSAYNLPLNAQVMIIYHPLCGGSRSKKTLLLPTYEIIQECEEQVMDELRLQSFPRILQGLGFGITPSMDDYVVKLIEDSVIFGYQIVRCGSSVDIAVACVNYAKLRSNGPIVRTQFVSKLIEYAQTVLQCMMGTSQYHRQSIEQSEEVFGKCRSILDDYDSFKKSPLVTKLYDLSMYCLANELFDGVGLTLTKLNFSRLSQEAIKRQYHMGPSFVQCLLDTTLFLCEQGVQCVKLGSIEPLVHGGKAYQEWFDNAMDLQVKAKCLSNPVPHGFTKFEFLKNLSDAIEKGDAISKFAAQIGINERKLVRSVLSSLKMIQADCITKGAAQKTRKAPFSILVFAGSSVGKSTFTDILFTYHAKIADLPRGSEYRYAVNFTDDFQSGFSTSQWCWLIDDIAFQHPNAAQGIDSSLLNVIQANNNAAFITNQADLPDKGRIPMWCEQVIGTTNVKDLNAVHYFSNPLAVQRRFPFVVELAPKPEYAKDECMLDGRNVPLVGDHEYPDWWIITVWRVVPQKSDSVERQRAGHELVFTTDKMTKFLMWYHDTWSAYDEQQKKVLEGNAKFDSILLCDCHHLPLSMCPEPTFEAQSLEYTEEGYYRVVAGERKFFPYSDRFPNPFDEPSQVEPEVQSTDFSVDDLADAGMRIFQDEAALEAAWRLSFFSYLATYMLQLGTYAFLEFSIFRSFVGWLYTFPVVRRLIWSVIKSTTKDSRVLMHMMGFMGNCVQRKIGRVPFLVTMAGLLVSGIATYKMISWLWSGPKTTLQAERRDGVKPTPDNEQGENVWYKSDFVLTDFDLSKASRSMKGASATFDRCLSKSIVKARFFTAPTKAFDQTLLALGGQYYLANNHGVPTLDGMRVQLVRGIRSEGVSVNLEITLSQSMIYRFPDRDQCIIEITNLPPCGGMLDFIGNTDLDMSGKGYLMRRSFEGIVDRITVGCMRYVHKFYDPLDCKIHSWEGRVDVATENGDCGSPLVMDTPQGPVIVGIHVLGDGRSRVVSVSTNQQFLRAQLESCKLLSGAEPMLNTQSIKRELTNLHTKSVFRYLEAGCAEVYGSFTGFKSSLKSRVCETKISKSVCAIFDVSLKHGAPVMKGWQPWRRAAKEMVCPVTKLDEGILSKCVSAFVADILKALPATELSKIEVYDDRTVVNGAPGVKFVNKMPRDTSMGFPWKCSKKHFLVDDINDEYPEGVKFTDEVMDRMRVMIDRYKSGVRAMPVFMGNLKDEAVKFKKIEIFKTRLFTGAPSDWSMIVRKYFLSVVRVIQRNKYVFEAAPGTNPQSAEWTQMYEYLTQHGEDRMIAGDFAAFDKSMPPCVILAAFRVLIEICKAAGYTDEDIRIQWGIAYDTAFPVVDFNGDLVQFFGSNPSGHPLTVVINSIANSLYMRYGYYVVNPAQECTSFKKKVALITYGDDNAMGVCRSSPWFSHTTLQQTLASVGITYTMADKEAESIPYIHIKNVSFLKRTWVYDDEVGYYMAPLEEESIFKMLTVGVASKTLCAEAQALAVIVAAQNEWFFYGRSYFEKQQRKLVEVVEASGLSIWVEPNTFLRWDALKMRFLENSRHMM